MNLPDLQSYYHATLLDQMNHWFLTTDDKLWLSIAKEVTKGNDLFALAIAYTMLPKVIIPKLLSVKAWQYISSKCHLLGEVHNISIPLRALDYCRARISMGKWINQGIDFYEHLSADKKILLKVFVNLSKKIEIRGVAWT